MKTPLDRTLSVAPMMDCTDKHYRYFARLIDASVLLYSEMLTAEAVIHGDQEKLLGFNKEEHPIALQLGGSVPEKLAKAAQIGEAFGYDEINLNVGCPSDRVQAGRFGACLMKEPELVAECVKAMKAVVSIPVTVKTRLGVDDLDSYEHLCDFVKTVAAAGCETFIIHARKAWLKGLSPKENRDIPPLKYERVYQLKRDFPHLEIILNGGVKTAEAVYAHLSQCDGVMIGRAAYSNPILLKEIQQQAPVSFASQLEIVKAYLPYIRQQIEKGERLRALIRPLIGLFQGRPKARHWRRYLSVNGSDQIRGEKVVESALELVRSSQ